MSDTAEPARPTPRTVLIIDDQHAVRVTLAFLLSGNYRVLDAESGSRALAFAAEENIEAALIDLHMPVMNGFETCQQLQAQAAAVGRKLRVWFMSAAFTTEARKRAMELGAVGVLSKPFDHEELFAGLEREFASPPSIAANLEMRAEPTMPS